MKIFKTKKQKTKEETYVIEYSMIEWLNVHLKEYLRYANKHLDLEYHKIIHINNTITLKKAIERIIEITDFLIKNENYFYLADVTCKNFTDEMYDLLKKAGGYIWW